MKKRKVGIGSFAKFTTDEFPMDDKVKAGDVEALLDVLINDLRELVEDENLRKVLESEVPQASAPVAEQKTEV